MARTLRAPAQVSHEAVEALLGRHRLLVGPRGLAARGAGDLRADRGGEGGFVELTGHRLRPVELLAQLLQMPAHLLVGPEMRPREAPWAPRLDQLKRGTPRVEVYVRRRRGRQHPALADAHTGHVSG